jgi:NADH-ubiquinone oxidoreductase chain 2
MIYGSTGATHFDQLAKILTGYEITGARSSGIFMGILFIAVGSLFKITAVPFRAAVGRPPIGGRVGWVVPLRLRPIFLTARGPGLERVKLITTS